MGFFSYLYLIEADKLDDEKADAIANATVEREDAKHATATCRDCGKVLFITRHILDRRSPRCYDCGGMLDFNDTSIVDEWVSLKEATRVAGTSQENIRSLIDQSKIVAKKSRGRWYIGKSSLEHAISMQHTNDELSVLMPFGTFAKGNICVHCKKTFRNPAALSLHVKEQHHDF